MAISLVTILADVAKAKNKKEKKEILLIIGEKNHFQNIRQIVKPNVKQIKRIGSHYLNF